MKVSHWLAAGLAAFALTAAAADPTGHWAGDITGPDGQKHPLTFDLHADGERVTGTVTGAPPTGVEQRISRASINGDKVILELTISVSGTRTTHTFAGTLTGNRITGVLETPILSLPFEVTRQ
jgi:hypothetical protein